MPGSVMFGDGVKDGEQLTHVASKGNLLGLASRTQALIEGTNDWIVTGGYQCSHIEDSSDMRATTPNCLFPSQGAAVATERSHACQGSYMLAVESSQFRQGGQKRKCQLRPCAGNRLQSRLLFRFKAWALGVVRVEKP